MSSNNASRTWWLLGGLFVLSTLVLLVWWPSFRSYPAATSPQSMYLMKLLYTACNLEDEQRLAKVEREVQQAANQNQMSSAEQQAFERIVGLAQAGNWNDAQQAALKFSQDQVGRGSSSVPRETNGLAN